MSFGGSVSSWPLSSIITRTSTFVLPSSASKSLRDRLTVDEGDEKASGGAAQTIQQLGKSRQGLKRHCSAAQVRVSLLLLSLPNMDSTRHEACRTSGLRRRSQPGKKYHMSPRSSLSVLHPRSLAKFDPWALALHLWQPATGREGADGQFC